MKASAWLFPERCMLCRAYLSEDQGGICSACRDRLTQEMEHIVCQPPEQMRILICASRYCGHMRRAILDAKFHGKRANLIPMANLMIQAWELYQMPIPDCVTCVPMSPVRFHARGFNQSEALARQIAAHLDVPFEKTLRRRVLSRRQSTVYASKRWVNAQRAFLPRTWAARSGSDLHGKTVLLVDDIVTTGATISTCAGLLRQMGAVRVWGLALACAGEHT